jgi:hypothetical protein
VFGKAGKGLTCYVKQGRAEWTWRRHGWADAVEGYGTGRGSVEVVAAAGSPWCTCGERGGGLEVTFDNAVVGAESAVIVVSKLLAEGGAEALRRQACAGVFCEDCLCCDWWERMCKTASGGGYRSSVWCACVGDGTCESCRRGEGRVLWRKK